MKTISLSKLLSFITLMAIIFSSKGAVWENENSWSLEWEEKYRQWVVSEKFRRDLFTNKESPLYKVKTDCADAVFAVRLFFSYLHKLPFAIENPSGTRRGEGQDPPKHMFIDNQLTRWDQLENPHQRLRAFLKYIGESVGSDYLARGATFAVKPKAISSGDAYIYKNGNGFHSYIIKQVYPTGNQRLWWSTVPRAVRRFSEKIGLPDLSFEKRPWGYRRFRWPEHLLLADHEIPKELGQSNQQYKLIKKGNPLQLIRDALATGPEYLVHAFPRYFKNACQSLEDRAEVLNQTVAFREKIGHRCMNSREYYDYSTPGRDNKIYHNINILVALWKEVLEKKIDHDIQGSMRLALHFLAKTNDHYSGQSSSDWNDDWEDEWGDDSSSNNNAYKIDLRGKTALKNICNIKLKYKNIKSIGLDQFYNLFLKKKISANPNDNISRRWGVKTGRRSRCRRY
jgi:hypothetical protein